MLTYKIVIQSYAFDCSVTWNQPKPGWQLLAGSPQIMWLENRNIVPILNIKTQSFLGLFMGCISAAYCYSINNKPEEHTS